MSSPAHDYYSACCGRWSAPLAITLVDADALRRSGMGWLDRMSVRLLASWPAWLGRVRLDTTVRFGAASDVVHTTVIRWLGLPLRKSTEVFTIDADGRHFIVHGDMTGAGCVDSAGVCAEYTLRWFGVELGQRTRREANRVIVDQAGPGFRAHHELIRVQ